MSSSVTLENPFSATSRKAAFRRIRRRSASWFVASRAIVHNLSDRSVRCQGLSAAAFASGGPSPRPSPAGRGRREAAERVQTRAQPGILLVELHGSRLLPRACEPPLLRLLSRRGRPCRREPGAAGRHASQPAL